MATPRLNENRLLDAGERELVDQTRHPAVTELDARELADVISRLRERRDRAKSMANQQRRNIRGKGNGREVTDQKADFGNRQKAGVLREALSRANKERSRREAEARNPQKTLARQALELKRNKPSRHANRPDSDQTADKGMNPVENRKGRQSRTQMAAGSISQQVRNAQARKDAR